MSACAALQLCSFSVFPVSLFPFHCLLFSIDTLLVDSSFLLLRLHFSLWWSELNKVRRPDWVSYGAAVTLRCDLYFIFLQKSLCLKPALLLKRLIPDLTHMVIFLVAIQDCSLWKNLRNVFILTGHSYRHLDTPVSWTCLVFIFTNGLWPCSSRHNLCISPVFLQADLK